MTRKLLMITTAVMAIAAAPVYAQSTSGDNSTASGTNMRPPAANQMPAPATPNAAAQSGTRAMNATGQMAQPQMKSDQAMSAKGASKSAKMERKATNRTSASATHRTPQYRAMNEREMAVTRDLNRQAVSGGVPQSAMTQSSMVPSTPMTAPMPGTSPSLLGGQSNPAGASGPANDAAGAAANK